MKKKLKNMDYKLKLYPSLNEQKQKEEFNKFIYHYHEYSKWIIGSFYSWRRCKICGDLDIKINRKNKGKKTRI